MNLRLPLFVLVCLLLANGAWAHIDKESLKEYKAAKKYYASSDYTAAKAILAPLMESENKSEITPYALFYYALSAYHNGEPTLAERTFIRIMEKYPRWEQRDEVWYWLGQLSFEAKDPGKGLARLARITDKTFEVPLEQMKKYFLQQLDDIFVLQVLLRQYPKDRTLAQVLFSKIVRQPLVSRDRDLLNTLERDFNLILEDNDPLKEMVSSKKESYNIGVFFPFFVDEVDYEEENSISFIIALYQGIKAAATALTDQGIEINLFAYDTKKDPTTTAALLKQEEVKSMDLIIGPFYATTIPLVADFARAHRINLFNPLSENSNVVGDNPFVFLFKPSLETQARSAAEFTLQNADKGLNVGIIYGNSKADAIQAHIYKQCIENGIKREVALMLSVAPEEAYSISNLLKEPPTAVGKVVELEVENEELTNLDDLTHLYVASKDELTVANILSVLATLKHPPCIIGHEAWLHHSSFTFDQLKQHRLYLVSPNYTDSKKSAIHEFRTRFYNYFKEYPTTYACVGYEMMLFLGRMLAAHGVYFQKHWEKDSYQGVIFGDITYGAHHDNQCVPIVQFQKDQFVICNQKILEE